MKYVKQKLVKTSNGTRKRGKDIVKEVAKKLADLINNINMYYTRTVPGRFYVV